jgi:hypothetical protein
MRTKKINTANSSARANRNKRNQKSEQDKENWENPFGLPKYGETPKTEGGFTFYPPLGSPPVDPRDCELYPDSPWCGGNPLTTTPVGFEDNEVTFNECGVAACTTPVAGFIKLPKRCLVFRKEECNQTPLPALPTQDIKEGIPVDAGKLLSGIPLDQAVFIINSLRTESRRHEVYERFSPSQFWKSDSSLNINIKVEKSIFIIKGFPSIPFFATKSGWQEIKSSGNGYFSQPPSAGEDHYVYSNSEQIDGYIALRTGGARLINGPTQIGADLYLGSVSEAYTWLSNKKMSTTNAGETGDATTYDFSATTQGFSFLVIPLGDFPPREIFPQSPNIFLPPNSCKPQNCCF